MHSIFTPVRVAAAVAKGQLLQAAAAELGGDVGELTVSDGVIRAPSGKPARFGSLTARRRSRRTTRVGRAQAGSRSTS